jgi:micrococcal nuclease
MPARFRCLCVRRFFSSSISGAPRPPLTAKVALVSDGDSVTAISDNGTKVRIRLLGIDAPEIARNGTPGQPFGEEAREDLDHLIGGKTIRVDAYDPEQYKPILGVIWDDQVNVNLMMAAMGSAEAYRGAACYVYCRELEKAEAKARRLRLTGDRRGWAEELAVSVMG